MSEIRMTIKALLRLAKQMERNKAILDEWRKQAQATELGRHDGFTVYKVRGHNVAAHHRSGGIRIRFHR